MKKVLFFTSFCFTLANAQQYTIYDMNGKNHGTFNDILSRQSITKFTKESHGSILVKKNTDIKIATSNNTIQQQLNIAQSTQIQKKFDLGRDSLSEDTWLEIDKNEIAKICIDNQVLAWETSLNSRIYNDSCLTFLAPQLIGVEAINIYFSNSDIPHKINLAVGMKYLNFKNENVLLGYNKKNEWKSFISTEEDPERIITVTGTYLVDKYPVTNCEITQLMKDSIPMNPSFNISPLQEFAEKWMFRKRNSNGNCITQDSAACTVFLLQAMKYANARSTREGLKPYYKISTTKAFEPKILSKGHYIISYDDFNVHTDEFALISTDNTSDGYRLPYYDEWMILARGGDKKKEAPWGDSSVSFNEVAKHAKFGTWKHYYESEPVGQLQPNGYGLYDIFGLVWEHVLFEEHNPFKKLKGRPSCLKGGDNHVELDFNTSMHTLEPYWKWINYGYSYPNYSSDAYAGFRLIRNIGNNAKWTEVKSDKE